MHRSLIEWTDYSAGEANFVRRGTKPGECEISEGCRHCYVERCWRRNPSAWPRETTWYPEKLAALAGWRPAPRGTPYRRGPGSKPMVFVCDTGDLFHQRVPDEFIVRALDVMAGRPDVEWQILTKRVLRMVELVNGWQSSRGIQTGGLPWLWFGATVENQRQSWRIERLMHLRSHSRWISVEPMIGALDLVEVLGLWVGELMWVVAGGESGNEARPMYPGWVRSLRDQCQVRGVPFFFKSWGEYAPVWDSYVTWTGYTMMRVGRKNAGRRLDGREWNEFPE